MRKLRHTTLLILAACSVGPLFTGCVKTRTVSEGVRVVSQGPVLVSPIRGTLRSHDDRR